MKKLIVTGVLMIWVSTCFGQGGTESVATSTRDTGALSASAKRFFDIWILKKNSRLASKYLSSSPILGSCMTPKSFGIKGTSNKRQVQQIFNKALNVTLKKIGRIHSLGDVVSSRGADIVSDLDGKRLDHGAQDYFSIFALNVFEDPHQNGYVCKSDMETTEFAEAISSPDVRYILTRIKVAQKYEPFILITVWKKEFGNWRIKTFSVTTEDS